MQANLTPIMSALGELEDVELRALMAAAGEVVVIAAAGLLAWIEHLADWELNRREGLHFSLQPPEAAIPPEHEVDSLAAALMLRQQFVEDAEPRASLVTLFDASLGVLTGGEQLH
jgi:hypothetical protein